MLDLSKEFRDPMEDDGWIAKILIGAFLILISAPWYLLPVRFLSYGYIYKRFVSRFRKAGDEKLPEWKDWKDLFLQGLVIYLIGLGYFIIPWVSYLVSDSIFMGGTLAKLIALAFFAATALLLVAAVFLLPMGIARYSRNERISEAFSIKEVWDKIMNIGDDYFKITLLSIVLIIGLALVGAVPYLGPVVNALLGFYVALVLASLFARVCREAHGLTEPESIEADIPEYQEPEASEPSEPEAPESSESEPPESEEPDTPENDEGDASETEKQPD